MLTSSAMSHGESHRHFDKAPIHPLVACSPLSSTPLSSFSLSHPHSPSPPCLSRFFGYKAGQVISCLRDVKAQVSKGCKQQLFKVMMDVSRDWGPVKFLTACDGKVNVV